MKYNFKKIIIFPVIIIICISMNGWGLDLSPWGPYYRNHCGVSYMSDMAGGDLAHFALTYGQYNTTNRSVNIGVPYDSGMGSWESVGFASVFCTEDYSRWDTFSSFPNNYLPITPYPSLGEDADIHINHIRYNSNIFLIIIRFENTGSSSQTFYASLTGTTYYNLDASNVTAFSNSSNAVWIQQPQLPVTLAASSSRIQGSWPYPLCSIEESRVGILSVDEFEPVLQDQSLAEQLFSQGSLTNGTGSMDFGCIQQDNIIVPAGESRIIAFTIAAGASNEIDSLLATSFDESVLTNDDPADNWPYTNDVWGTAMQGTAAQSLLNLVFMPDQNRVRPVPSRYYYHFYYWDSCAHSVGLLQPYPGWAKKVITEDLLPGIIHDPTINVMSWWTLYQRTGDLSLLSNHYEDVTNSINGLDALDPDGDYLYRYGQGQFGNGMDDNPMHEDIYNKGTNIETPDDQAFALRHAKIMRIIAYELQRDVSEINELTTFIDQTESAVDSNMWNETTGWYDTIYETNNEHTDVGEYIVGAYPLISGSIPTNKLQAVLDNLMDTDKYMSGHGFRTADYTGPFYDHSISDDGFYWRGTIWIPPNWLLWRGLLDYGKVNEARQVAYDLIDNWSEMHQNGKGKCYELFHGINGKGIGHKTFSGLSTPVVDIYGAYCVKGTVTAGFDTTIRNINYNAQSNTLRFDAESPFGSGPAGFIAVMETANTSYDVSGQIISSDQNGAVTFTTNILQGETNTILIELYPGFTPTPTPSPSPTANPQQYFNQDSGPDGIISIEAEHYNQNDSRSGHSWNVDSAYPGSSGGIYMIADPDNGILPGSPIETLSPELTYNVDFVKTGKHYMWIRYYSVDSVGDSCYIGFNDSVTASGICNNYGNYLWTWSKTGNENSEFIVSSTGEQTVHVWMREDGLRIDKIVITTSSNYVPTGYGPAESARSNSALPPATPTPTPDIGGNSLFTDNSMRVEFETGDLSEFNLTDFTGIGEGYAATSETSNGLYSFYSGVTNGANGDKASGYKNISNISPTGRFQMEFNFFIADTGSSSMYCCLADITETTGGWSDLLRVRIRPSDNALTLRVRTNGDTGDISTGVSSGALSLSNWYNVKALYDISGADVYCELWLDHVSLGSFTGNGKSADNPSMIRTGISVINWAANNWANVFFDDIVCHDGSVSATPTVSPSPTATPAGLTPTPTMTPAATPTPTMTPVATMTPAVTPTPTITPPASPTPDIGGFSLFADGSIRMEFETGDISEFNSTEFTGTGSGNATNSEASNGIYSFYSYVTNGSVGDKANGFKDLSNISPTGRFEIEFNIYIADLGSSSMYTSLADITESTGGWGDLFRIRIRPSDKTMSLRVRESGDSGDVSTGITSTALSLSNWYNIKAVYDVSGVNVFCELWLDDVSQGNFSGTGKSTDNPATLQTGIEVINWAANNWAVIFFDDIVCHDGNDLITPTPTASPTPTTSPTPASTASPTASATPTPIATASPTPASTASPTPTATASPTSTPTASPTPTTTASPTASPEPSAAPTTSPSPTPMPTINPLANLINNGDFETADLSGYFTEGAFISSDQLNGTNSCQIGPQGYISQEISSGITPNTNYIVSAWVKVLTQGNSWGSTRLRSSKWKDLGSARYGEDIALDKVSAGWQYLEFTNSFTQKQINGKIYVGARNYGMPGTVVIDDIFAAVHNTPTPEPTATPETGTATPEPEVNLIANGDFEAGNLAAYNANAAVVSTLALGSTYSAKLSPNGYVSQEISGSLTAGTEYRICAYIKVIQEGGSWGAPILCGSTFSDLGSFEFNLAAAADSVHAGWQYIEFTYIFSAGQLAGNVNIGVKHFGMPGTSVIDNLKVVKK